MEKYKRYTDAATGINPFVDRGFPHNAPLWASASATVLCPVVLLIHLAMVTLAMPFYVLFRFGTAIGLPGIRWLHWVYVRLVFSWLLNTFASSSSGPAPFPPRAAPPGVGVASNKNDELQVPEAGDVVVANCQSPLDCVVLQHTFPHKPIFFAFPNLFPSSSAAEGEAIVEQSVGGAMNRVLNLTSPAGSFDGTNGATPLPPVDLRKAQRVAQAAAAVLVVFGEGATTNGRGILRLPDLCVADSGAVHLVALSYRNTRYPAILPQPGLPGFFWLVWHFVRASFAQRGNGIDVGQARPSSIPSFAGGGAGWSSAMQARLGTVASFHRPADLACRPVDLNALDKRRFLCQWSGYQKK